MFSYRNPVLAVISLLVVFISSCYSITMHGNHVNNNQISEPVKVYPPERIPPILRQIRQEDRQRGEWFAGFGSGVKEGMALGRREGELNMLEFQIRLCFSIRPNDILQCLKCVSVKDLSNCRYPCISNMGSNFCDPPSFTPRP